MAFQGSCFELLNPGLKPGQNPGLSSALLSGEQTSFAYVDAHGRPANTPLLACNKLMVSPSG
jgi:hypothetical protein